MKSERSSIYYFEDDPRSLEDYVHVLRMSYDVEIGASHRSIFRTRTKPIDIVIVDLMIHQRSPDEDSDEILTDNIQFEGTDWWLTGIEFLRRIRSGEYEKFGFPCDVPVVVATAKDDYSIQEEVKSLGASVFLTKVFTISVLEEAIETALLGETENES